jgi:FtsH-binding integral membrane protein
MANWSDPRTAATPQPTTAGQDVAFDAGLRSHMLSVYNYMASAVLLTGVVAMLFSRGGVPDSPAYQLFSQGGPLAWVVILAPLGLVMWLSFGINRISTGTAKTLFWVYALLMGLSLSTIFLVYTTGSIAQAFFATAAAFASLSLWGYTTKRDLSAMGTFLIMGLFGLIIAMIINFFMRSTAMDLAISAIGVLLFAGLTAYDTQKIKSMYFAVAGTESLGKAAVMGALTLYLDFINLFLFLLRLFGDRR